MKQALLSGIKNSWKYEKDLIILNRNFILFTIKQSGYFYVFLAEPVFPHFFYFLSKHLLTLSYNLLTWLNEHFRIIKTEGTGVEIPD